MKKLFFIVIITAILASACKPHYPKAAEGKQVDVIIKSGKSYLAGTLSYPFKRDTIILPGLLAKESDFYGETQAAVLLLPGFLGERDELPVTGTASPSEGGKPLGIWEMTAMQLAEAGYMSLRIDYRNSGKSPGEWKDITLDQQLEDVKTALKWLSKHPDVDPQRLTVLGLSLGGLLAAQVSTDSRVAAVGLWSAAADFSWLPTLVGEENIQKVEASGSTEVSTVWGEQIILTKAYLDSIQKLNPMEAIAEFDGPLLSIVGSKDTVVSPQPEIGERFLKIHQGTEESLIILDADHTFNSFIGSEEVNKAIDATIQWLDNTLSVNRSE